MYKEKVNLLLKEAFEATKKLLQENGDKTCVYSDEYGINVFTEDGEICTVLAIRLSKGGQDPYGGWRALEVYRSYINGWGWDLSENICSYNYADFYDFVSENLDSAITYKESKEINKFL
ncbi:MAG: hypothetical protein NC453_19320 [Muribaculum sp.]|nr:hypothetical protein [Muribaculum sp.]